MACCSEFGLVEAGQCFLLKITLESHSELSKNCRVPYVKGFKGTGFPVY